MTAEHVVYETRAVEAGRRTLTPVAITGAQVLFGGGEHTRSTGRGGRRSSSDGCRALSTRAWCGAKADTVSSQGGGDRHWPDRSTHHRPLKSRKRDVDLRSHHARKPGQKRQGASDSVHCPYLDVTGAANAGDMPSSRPTNPASMRNRLPPEGIPPRRSVRVSTRRSRARVIPT